MSFLLSSILLSRNCRRGLCKLNASYFKVNKSANALTYLLNSPSINLKKKYYQFRDCTCLNKGDFKFYIGI